MADITRQVPYNAEAEQWVIGSILIDNSLFGSIYELIKPDDFYINDNKVIFSAMASLSLANKTIDGATITNELSGNTSITYDDLSSYLLGIVNSIPTTYDALDYAKIIKEKSLLRKLIAASDEIQESAYTNQNNPQGVLDHAEQLIYDIGIGNETRDFVQLSDAFVTTFKNLDKLKSPDERESFLGQKTGLSDLDDILVGMGEGDLIILGARPGMGKTSLALNIAINVAKQNKTVCMFSLEMSAEQIASRILSSEALVDSYKLRTGNVDENDLYQLVQMASQLSKVDFRIDDTSGISVAQMKSKIRRTGQKVGLVVIDYLQLMTSDKRTENRVQEVSEITRNLKLMAKDLKVPVLCCAQLSRASTKDAKDKRPSLSDLRESGSIEQDADVIMLLYSDEYFKKDGVKPPVYDVECNVAKNRHGETKPIKLKWMSKFTKFTSADKEHYE